MERRLELVKVDIMRGDCSLGFAQRPIDYEYRLFVVEYEKQNERGISQCQEKEVWKQLERSVFRKVGTLVVVYRVLTLRGPSFLGRTTSYNSGRRGEILVVQ